MDFFKPSKNVLEMICSEGEMFLASYEVFPFSSQREMHELLVLYCTGIFEKIIHVYKDEGIALSEEAKRRLNYQGINNVIGELFKNWIDHSPEDSTLFTGSFFGLKGVCYGFQDGGEFFKSSEIKKQLENKILFEKFNLSSRGDNCHSGFNQHIFPDSDFIEVDSEKGILYCVQFKKNLIAPEGEHGSQYFYDLKEKKK